jgi:hypothetical protein
MVCATLILSEFALQQTHQTMLDLKHVYLLMDIGVMNSLESYSNFDPPPKKCDYSTFYFEVSDLLLMF